MAETETETPIVRIDQLASRVSHLERELEALKVALRPYYPV